MAEGKDSGRSGRATRAPCEPGSLAQEVAELARGEGAPRRSVDARRLRPMLAATAEGPFSREGWLFEIKYDGARVLAAKRADGGVQLYSRNGRDTTSTYPELSEALRRLPVEEFILDGEVVALDARGRSSFERLQRRLSCSDPDAIARARAEVPVVLYAFDLLFASHHDLRDCPLRARKQILERLLPRRGGVRFADHVEGEGETLFEVLFAAGHDLRDCPLRGRKRILE